MGTKSKKSLQNKVLAWFDAHGRKTLPWQYQKTPYRVWLSEIMLQQTQVSTVIPYFERFTQKFPEVSDLAAAPLDEVLHYWTGLGYYSRARNLHKTAAIVVENGGFPRDLAGLQQLPGIGRSTAGAIMSIAFEQSAAILDGNVKRVLTRLHGIATWPGEKKTHDDLWVLAEHYTPTERTADYTQAMMDLGATLCTRSQPRCSDCPLQSLCVSFKQDLTRTIPARKPKKTLPTRSAYVLAFMTPEQDIYLEKRASPGIWGGLWSLPELATASAAEIAALCRKQLGGRIVRIEQGATFKHTFSHYHFMMTPVYVQLHRKPRKNLTETQQIWYNLHQPATLGLPAPIKSLLQGLRT